MPRYDRPLPAEPERWHRYQYLYSNPPKIVLAQRVTPETWRLQALHGGATQEMSEACFSDRYDWIPSGGGPRP
jgi:hypothetical protein